MKVHLTKWLPTLRPNQPTRVESTCRLLLSTLAMPSVLLSPKSNIHFIIPRTEMTYAVYKYIVWYIYCNVLLWFNVSLNGWLWFSGFSNGLSHEPVMFDSAKTPINHWWCQCSRRNLIYRYNHVILAVNQDTYIMSKVTFFMFYLIEHPIALLPLPLVN